MILCLPPVPGRQTSAQPSQSQQGAQHSTAQHAVSPAAGTGTTGGCGLHGPGVQLLQTDCRCFCTLSSCNCLPDTQAASDGSSSGSGSSSSSSGSAAVPLSMLLLQRIHIRTPASPFMFAPQPRVRLSGQGVQHTGSTTGTLSTAQEAGSTASAATVSASSSGTDNSSSSSGVTVECEGEQALPADSLVVVNPPKVHAAPRDWLNFLAALPWQPCSSCCCGSNGCI